MAKRQAKNPILSAERRAAAAGGAPVLLETELTAPLRLRKPARIGVQFMGDLFHGEVRDKDITAVFNVMCDERAQRHTFMVLTKRPNRMSRWLEWLDENEPGDSPVSVTREVCEHFGRNVWLGVSVPNNDYRSRIDELLKIPAAVRFVSYEPALGPVDLGLHLARYRSCVSGLRYTVKGAAGDCDVLPSIDWLIAGGESGPKARPSHPDWFRRVRDDCQAAGVPFFFKGWGTWRECPKYGGRYGFSGRPAKIVYADGRSFDYATNWGGEDEGVAMEKHTKAVGRLLDGREWNEVPTP
jgi:protein gp37